MHMGIVFVCGFSQMSIKHCPEVTSVSAGWCVSSWNTSSPFSSFLVFHPTNKLNWLELLAVNIEQSVVLSVWV